MRPETIVVARPIQRVYYGWWIVAAWFVLNVYWAGTLNYGLTVFFTPVRQSFGWDAALMASIFSLANLLSGLLSPLTGAFFDRNGPRLLMMLASTLSGVGLLALSQARSLEGFLAAFTLVSLGYGMWSGTGMATVSVWFRRRRGLAMGVVVTGSAVGGLLVPLWQLAVSTEGWQMTFALAGGAMLIIGLSAAAVLRRRPSDLGLLPDGDRVVLSEPANRLEQAVAEARRSVPPIKGQAWQDGDAGFRRALGTWQFWTVSVITSVILAGSTAATVLLLPRLQEAHVDPRLAITAATAAILLGVVGRTSTGFLCDRLPITSVAVAIFCLQGASLLALALAPAQLPVLLVFVVGYGLSNDIVRMLASLLLVRYYGTTAFGRILGVHLLILLPGRVLGPIIAGAFHDHGMGYGAAFLVFALASFAMVGPVRLLRHPG